MLCWSSVAVVVSKPSTGWSEHKKLEPGTPLLRKPPEAVIEVITDL